VFQSKSIHDLLSSRLSDAADQVRNLGLDQLRNPALAGLLTKLWTSRLPEVPVIFLDRKHGRKRVEQRHQDDHGRNVIVEVTYLDVSVPFHGDGSMFDMMPSTSTIIHDRVHVQEGALIYSLHLDEANDDKINRLFAQIEGNLKSLRSDIESFGASAVNQLSRFAAERRAKLEEDEQKARKLSFPVD
jgi:hypothetical protein